MSQQSKWHFRVLDEIRGDFSAQTILALMKVANSEEDEMADTLQRQLVENEIELTEFIPKMLKLRKSYNTRRIKIDKLSELEQQTAAVGGGNGRRAAPYSKH